MQNGFTHVNGFPQAKEISPERKQVMKTKTLFVYIFAILTVFPILGTVAPAATIAIIQTFDFPPSADAVNATLPQKVSDQLDVTGTVIFLSGRTRAFTYKIRIKKFSPPLHDPNDTGFVTRGRGINNLRHLVGEYLNGADGTYHGYKLFYPDFVDVDVPGALETMPLGENNAGNFVWRSAWDIPELTALTAKASLEPDPKKRGELYVEMQKMFVDQKPAVLPMFDRPFEGTWPVGNDFDHDLPVPGDANGHVLTLCGVRDTTQVDGHDGYDLHFGVARETGGQLRLVDPYGLPGPGADPWALDSRGAPSAWLWKSGQAPPL